MPDLYQLVRAMIWKTRWLINYFLLVIFHILLNILGLFHLFFAAYVKARDSDFRKIEIIEQLEMETSLQIHPRTIYFLMISVAVSLCNTVAELSIGSSVSFLPLHFCNFFVFRVKIQNIFQSLSKFLVLS